MPLLSPPSDAASFELSRAFPNAVESRRTVHVAEWLVLLAVVAYIGGRALPRAWRHLDTDFPNYYITARLLREGYATDRVYEWIWLQRQKDRMGILPSDQPVVGFVPHTPFSALLLWPLTYWPPLVAKRIWIACNLLLLLATGVLLHSLTRLHWRRLALIIGLSYPLLRSFQYGQYYLALLALITAALWLYVRQRRFAAGVLMGVASGLKIFPVFFVFYFARKRDLRSVIGLCTGTLATVVASLCAFGPELLRTYFTQVLPWALRGEAMNPYALSPNSLSAVLHKLFVFEPRWNPHPVVHAPAVLAVLHPIAQLLIFAPAIFLSSPDDNRASRLQLEWSAFVVALLAISTLPASYHFTLLLLPVAVLASGFLRAQNHVSLALLLVLYLAIGFPSWPSGHIEGWWALTAVPRLYFLLLLCGLGYLSLSPPANAARERDARRWTWTAALAALLVVQTVSTLRHQRGVYDGYGQSVAMPSEVLSASQPSFSGHHIDFIGMKSDGYFLGTVDASVAHLPDPTSDQLSHASAGELTWVEEAREETNIIRTAPNPATTLEVRDAEFPVVSPQGKSLAYLRSNKGRSKLWLHALTNPKTADTAITPTGFDVREMTFTGEDSLIFAAARNEDAPALYQVSPEREIQSLDSGTARYPAASPDGRWLAYSRLERGVWKLWLRDLQSGEARRLTDAECNNISPAWQSDSRTLIYASDCGRALWFTALRRVRVVP